MEQGSVLSPFRLPLDLLSIIIQHLPDGDKLNLRLTSKSCRELVDKFGRPLKGIDNPK
jgi:hypothetical protein